MVFSFTFLGGKVERSVRKGLGPDMFQLHGENYHLAGSLRPKDGTNAKFGQLYIADTEMRWKTGPTVLGNEKFTKYLLNLCQLRPKSLSK